MTQHVTQPVTQPVTQHVTHLTDIQGNRVSTFDVLKILKWRDGHYRLPVARLWWHAVSGRSKMKIAFCRKSILVQFKYKSISNSMPPHIAALY